MMMQRARLLASWSLLALVLSLVGVLAQESSRPHEIVARQNEFQSLVGGLGFGSSVNLSPCSFSFDPRMQPACSHVAGPIPAGFALCPAHLGCATSYPHLVPFPISEAATDDHATSR
jgi:hypothetical protein